MTSLCTIHAFKINGVFKLMEYLQLLVLFLAPPQINEDASPTPVYSFVGNRKPVAVTCMFYGYPVPIVIMRDENGTEIARGNSSASYIISDTTEDDFGMFNCTAESPDGKAEYLVELRKAGICMNIATYSAKEW